MFGRSFKDNSWRSKDTTNTSSNHPQCDILPIVHFGR